jgi:putative inorganic carbon (hco3(-)) transporter
MIFLKKDSKSVISFLFHALFFFTPLLLWPRLSEVFEFPKMLFVYGTTTLITATWLLKQVKQKRFILKRTPLDIPILLFLLFQILATVFSIDPYTSIWGYYSRFHGGLASTISYLLLFYIFISTTSKKDEVKSYLNTLLLSSGLISVYAILERLGIDKNLWVQDVQNRVFSTLGQPNWLSAYLVAILPLPIFLFKEKRQFKYLILTSIILLSILFTKSRSGLAATGVTLLLTFSYLSYTYRKLPHFLASLALIITPILLFKSSIITSPFKSLQNINPFYSTTKEVVEKDLENRKGGSDSMVIRRVVWQGAVDLGKKYPFLGTGPETFAYSYYQKRPAEHNLLSEWDFLYNKAHNEYLNSFASSGFLGLGSYLLLIIWTLAWWVKTIRKSKGKDQNLISTPLLIGWISILITNFFGFSVVAVALLFFLFPSLAISLSSKKDLKSIDLKLPLNKTISTIVIISITIYLLSCISKTFRADLNYQSAKSLVAVNQNQKALVLLQKSVDLQPKQPLFLAQLAEQESKTAATIFLQTETLPEETRPAARKIQQSYQKSALKNINQAVDLNPHNLNLLKSKARVEIYLSNIDQKYTQDALNTLLQTSILAPTDPRLFLNIGLLYQTLDQNDLATQSFKKALSLKPNYQEALKKIQPSK